MGEGLRQKRRAQMQYAGYNVLMACHWSIRNQFGIRSDATSCWAPEKETCDLNDAAYALLMEAIRDTRRS
jgi:hypothetical protein